MKIQKAEMKFVSFDAQDVIATSGGPLFAYFTVAASLYPGHESDYKGDGVWSWGSGFDATTSTIKVGGASVTDGTTYQLSESSSFTLNNGLLDISNATSTVAGEGDPLSDLNAIVIWLGKHGAQ